MNNSRSVIGINFRYLSYKYKIDRHIWYKNVSCLLNCVDKYYDIYELENHEYFVTGAIIRELILTDNHLFNVYERKLMIDYLCTA